MPAFSRTLASLPIRRKLQLITLILLPVVVVLTVMTLLTIEVLSGLRAYVVGESLFSKYQKDAAFYLDRFVRDGRDTDLERFRQAIDVPLGDVDARRELERDTPDFEEVRRHLLRGRNAPQDVPRMIRIFLWLRDVPHVREAIRMWAEAIPKIYQLIQIADAADARRDLSPEERTALLGRIEGLNAELIELENRFTEAMSDGFRQVARLLLVALLLVNALLLGAGLWMGDRIARGITRQVGELARGASALAGGDRATRVAAHSGDELGRLAGWFNEMAANVEQAEGDLRRTLSILTSTLESTEDGILVLDREAHLVAWNQKLLGIWDLGPADLSSGMSIEAVLHVARKLRDPEAGLERFREVLADPAATTRDLLDFADGRVVERYSQPQHDGERIVGRVFSFRDVTEKKRSEEELLRSNRELEQFAYVASHDLQEPLRTVASYVQLLARRYRGKLDADADEFIGFAVDGAVRMQNLIRDLLQFSRVGTRGKALEPTDSGEVLDRVVENLRAMMEHAGAKVTHDTLPRVLADPIQLGQLFQNLLTNAIKFRGEAPPVIRVNARREGYECFFSVSDNGIGIPPESRDRVFVIFQRLHPVGKYEGTGIGLAICRKIVERHGGRIWVDADEEPGTTFHFTLPAAA